MQIVGLTSENVKDYASFLTEDAAQWIGRVFSGGFVLLKEDEETVAAGIIWELESGEEDLDTDCHIISLKAVDEESAVILLDEFTQLVADMGCNRTLFELPTTLGSVEKNALEKAGFSLETKEGRIVSIALADIGMALLSHKNKQDDKIKPLSEADSRLFDVAIAELDMDGIRGTCMDMAELPMDFYEKDISCFSEDEGDISAMALFHKRPSGKLELNLLSNVGDSDDDPIELLKQAVFLAEGIYAPNTKFLFDKSNANIKELLDRFFPKAKAVQVIAGCRKEEIPESEEDFDEEDIEYEDEIEQEDYFDLE